MVATAEGYDIRSESAEGLEGDGAAIGLAGGLGGDECVLGGEPAGKKVSGGEGGGFIEADGLRGNFPNGIGKLILLLAGKNTR